MGQIPFLDLRAQYLTIKPDIDAAIQRTIDTTSFIGGEQVHAFEREFAGYCANQEGMYPPTPPLYAVGCANGTDAIYLTLRAMGIGAGDEVITVSHTFTATAETIVLAGAVPVFVDICEDTMLMSPAAVEAAITPRTRAIIPVHLYGQLCDMDEIMAIARRHDLRVIEDAAQAHGARWRGRRAGCMGDAATFSFYPGKNLGGYGDGGAVVSSNQALIERIRMLGDHGSLKKYMHLAAGVNSRLDGIQAAILRVKLEHLDRWNAARREHARSYIDALRDTGVTLPVVDPNAEPVWHLFVIRVEDRERLQVMLAAQGIGAGFHYPVPLHDQPAYSDLDIPRESLPVTERVARTVISLPMYAELPEDAAGRVADVVASFVSSRSRVLVA